MSSVRAIEAEVSIKSGVQAECTIGREVVVEVHDEVTLESLTVTANGQYTPAEGVDGFTDVTVQVPERIPVTESLSVTENGTYEPDAGIDGYDRVSVSVPERVPMTESLTVTQNGNYTPSGGVDGFSSVSVSVPERQPDIESLNATIGSLTSTGGVDASATLYKTSNYIALEANTDYTLTSWRSDKGAITTSRKYVALYDSTKTFISESYQNVNGASFIAFNSGTSGKYVRVTVGDTNNAFVKKGSAAPSAFVAYTEEYSTDMTVEKYKAGSINPDALSAELQDELLHKPNINLFDSTEAESGVLGVNTGSVGAGSYYITSGFIPIKQGYTYTISPACRRKCFYSTDVADASGFIVGDDTSSATPQSFVSEYTGYMRFSVAATYTDNSVVESYIGTLTKKVEEGVSLSETQKVQVFALIEDTANLGYDVLYGKKWAVCGDSFTKGGGTGTAMPAGTKYAGQSYTYPWIIGSRQNMNIVKFFEGGRTLAFPAEPGTFTNSLTNPSADWYYQNIPADADYITIYLGINDEHHSSSSSGGDGENNTGIIPIGTIDDNTTATYLGAWNVVLTWLITNRPNAHIGIIITNGIANKDQYRQGQIAIAEKYGIPYIDMNGDARTPAMLRTSNPNIPASIKQALITKWAVNPGTNEHPNDAAQLFESTFIENFLRSI